MQLAIPAVYKSTELRKNIKCFNAWANGPCIHDHAFMHTLIRSSVSVGKWHFKSLIKDILIKQSVPPFHFNKTTAL